MAEVSISADLLLQTVSDEAVILDPATGRYFTLNPVATRMLQLYRATPDSAAVVDAIVTEYAVDAAVARRDLQALLDDLVARGLAAPADAR